MDKVHLSLWCHVRNKWIGPNNVIISVKIVVDAIIVGIVVDIYVYVADTIVVGIVIIVFVE